LKKCGSRDAYRIGIKAASGGPILDVSGDIRAKSQIIILASDSNEGGQLILADGGQYNVVGESTQVWNIDVVNSTLRFHRSSNGTRLTLTSDGKLGVGVEPSYLLHLNGGARSDGLNWYSGSDRAYKKDIDYDFNYGLDEINKLQPVYYVYKSDKDNKRHVGFIAQDMIKVIPEVVSGEDGSFGLDYAALTAVLTNAIKEQQKEIDELKSEINALKITK
jgi:hypothetical protein